MAIDNDTSDVIIERLYDEIKHVLHIGNEENNLLSNHTPTTQILSFFKQLDFNEKNCDEKNYEAQCNAIGWLSQEDQVSKSTSTTELLNRYILAVLYFSTEGDSWLQCSRQLSAPCQKIEKNSRFLSTEESVCDWYGIECKEEEQQIISIDLSQNGLTNNEDSSSIIPNEILLLNHLQLLWMPKNLSLGGTLPSWIGMMESLKSLNLCRTGLQGTVPDGLYDLTALNSLRLYKNNLSGTISSKINKMKELNWLWLHENKFEGKIPNELGQLTALEGLTIHQNDFEEEPVFSSAVCNLRTKNLGLLWTNCIGSDPDSVQCECCTRCFVTSEN